MRRSRSSLARERAADAEWFRQHYASEPVDVLLAEGERVEAEKAAAEQPKEE